MYTRAACAVVLAVSLLMTPMGLAGEKDKDKDSSCKPAEVKKETQAKKESSVKWYSKKTPAAVPAKSGTAPLVRTIPYQGSTAKRTPAATTRPAGEYKFVSGVKYDYFADRYGVSTSKNVSATRPASDVHGYVAPADAKSANKDNPFIYRRGD